MNQTRDLKCTKCQMPAPSLAKFNFPPGFAFEVEKDYDKRRDCFVYKSEADNFCLRAGGVNVLGHGAFGFVFRGQHRDGEVAVKRHRAFAEAVYRAQDGNMERWIKEARWHLSYQLCLAHIDL